MKIENIMKCEDFDVIQHKCIPLPDKNIDINDSIDKFLSQSLNRGKFFSEDLLYKIENGINFYICSFFEIVNKSSASIDNLKRNLLHKYDQSLIPNDLDNTSTSIEQLFNSQSTLQQF